MNVNNGSAMLERGVVCWNWIVVLFPSANPSRNVIDPFKRATGAMISKIPVKRA